MMKLYPFDEVREHFGMNDRKFMRLMKSKNAPYLKVGHKKYFTPNQLDNLYEVFTCYPSSNENTATGTSEALSPMVTEWLKSGELQVQRAASKPKLWRDTLSKQS